ncbi:MAG: hypothetical protein H7Y32_14245 [Chloroflexales bacterium]|nr:hypothetical protein [Chloroflexales bacterium]
MSRRIAPQLLRLQRPFDPYGSRLSQPQDSTPPPPREPQIVDRRGTISALIQATPYGYEIFWRLVRGDTVRELARRGPYPTRALAICWARVGLLLREEAWRAIHG